MVEFTGWRKPISMSGLGKAVAVYCADGLVFWAVAGPCFTPSFDPRRLVICVRPRLFAECASH
jgi:hypothetical protein